MDPRQRHLRRLLPQLPADGELPGDRSRDPLGSRPKADPDLAVRTAPACSRPPRHPGPGRDPPRLTRRDLLALGASRGADIEFHRPVHPRDHHDGDHGGAGGAARAPPQFDAAAPRLFASTSLGSMAGIALFTVLSAARTPPIVWFIVLARPRVSARHRERADADIADHGGVVGGRHRLSSACRRCRTRRGRRTTRSTNTRTRALHAINVNGIPHQALWPADGPMRPVLRADLPLVPGADLRQRPDRRARGQARTCPSRSSHGAGHVDAVEIDPAIQAIGVRDHPDRPYDDPRVTRIVEDGRAFLRRATSRYDLVIFALPDSLTLVSTSANLRLESFLFTVEAFHDVRAHLNDDGVFVLYNYYREAWLPQKIGGMLQDALRVAPIIHSYGQAAATLAVGPDDRGPRWPGAARRRRRPDRPDGCATAGDRRLAVPLPARTLDRPVLPRRPRDDRGPGRAVGRACRTPEWDVDPPVQSAFLRARYRIPAARDPEPRDVQPALRDDLARECARLLRGPRERAAGDPHQPALPVQRALGCCTRGSSGRSR